MDAGRSAAPAGDGEESVDRYLLQFWPDAPGPDEVVRQTGEAAEYWHRHARTLKPPPPQPSPDDVAARARQERLAVREGFELRHFWAGRPPSPRLRHVGGNVRALAQRDRQLLDALDEAGPETQRAVARWAARLACAAAGLAAVDWVAAGLRALDAGAPLPAPFDDLGSAFDRLHESQPGAVTVTVTIQLDTAGDDAPSPRVDARYAALPAVVAAAEADPLRAAIDALTAAVATVHDDSPQLLDDLRRAFPQLVPP